MTGAILSTRNLSKLFGALVAVDGVLDEAECTTADISQVLLVGGSSRIPYVARWWRWTA